MGISPHHVTRRNLITRVAGRAAALALTRADSTPAAGEEISRNNEAIHQEVLFDSSAKRVFATLTDSARFEDVIQLSAAMKSGMALGEKPTLIHAVEGGTFTLYRGHIIGRQIELVPAKRIVQAWRVVDWDPGIYSVAKFVLEDQGQRAKLVFDHTGFPQTMAQHLADGWQANYWEPMAKLFASEGPG
jgi:activator of HSP90 ATPase